VASAMLRLAKLFCTHAPVERSIFTLDHDVHLY